MRKKIFAALIVSILFASLIEANRDESVQTTEPVAETTTATTQEEKPEIKVEKEAEPTKPAEKPTQEITWRDNPNNCEDTTRISAEPPFACLPTIDVKPVAPQPSVTQSTADATSGVEQWRSLVSQYDWPVETVLAIMNCESGGNSQAVGDTTTAYASYGLMQIRALPGRPAPSQLLDPSFNIQYAYELYAGQGFSPWTCFYKI